MISVEQLTVEFGGQPLFDGISFLVSQKDKIALVGRNGAGKTTLLKLIAGKAAPSSGNISRQNDISIGYLPQHLIINDTKTVFEEALTAFDEIFRTKQKIEKLTAELVTRTDYNSPEYQNVIEFLDYENERLRMFGSQNMEAETEKTLLGLGFLRTDFTRKTSEFSGGWRMRIELAKILLQNPDLLLLDEPTNHLDIESIAWLERFLANTKSAVILVSHDKTFIDAATNRTIEISLGKIYDYRVNYSKYLILREKDRENQLHAYENQQKMIAETEDFIERFRYKPTKAVQVQSRIKQLEKLKRIEVDMQDNSHLNLKFPPAPHSGILPIDIENLTKCYGENIILQNVNLQVRRGEKIAFVGRNGEGKTTLVKCIMNEVDYSGNLKLGHNVKIGYFAQNQAMLLDEQKTVFQTIDDAATGEIRTKIRNILGAFMFGGEESEKKVAVLSGGERSRLAMIKLLLEPVNLLILDEPTNHLDISSKNVLKEAIKNFSGTAVIVSHDRDFLDSLVTKVYEFSNKKITEHIGGIDDFLRTKNFSSLNEVELRTNLAGTMQLGSRGVTCRGAINRASTSYEEQKELAKKARRHEKLISETETEISSLETQLSDLETAFAQGNSTAESTINYNKTKHLLEQKMYEWEVLNEELGLIKN
ncbi:MAG: ABC-F family ATP-binding cassette domain-containing protein [Prevotellaceae bacterium]|jgi:ATP-binding cassette subfamily F protein 3|nr:ABC-F family ATP-binding cassette domain-containing protein [Prevotellaceae bacterium]